MFVRDVDFSGGAREIVPTMQLQLLNFQVRCLKIQLRRERIDWGFEDGQRFSRGDEVSADLAIAGIHGSIDRNFTGEVPGIGAEKAGKVPQITDRSRNIAAKIGIEPARLIGGEGALAAQGELVLALLNLKLLQLNLSIVERGPEHNRLGGALAPFQPGQLRPN